MIRPTIVQLTKSKVKTIPVHEIIYGEVTPAGAMGNSGGLLIYIIEDDVLMRYVTSVFTNEEVFELAEELILKHSSKSPTSDDDLQNNFLEYFYGGMGNNAFVNKNMTVEIHENHFIYKKENISFNIFASVWGVFNNVAAEMKKRRDTKEI